MKIIWKKNPLKTYYELNDEDIEKIRKNIEIDALNWFKSGIEFYRKKDLPLEELNAKIDIEIANYNLRLSEDNLQGIVDELTHPHSHAGDCTKLPASCMKCYSEGFLEVDSLDGLKGIHEIFSAFYRDDGTEVTIEEALDYLKNYNPSFEDCTKYGWKDKDLFESWVPKWKKDAQDAYESLLKYKEKHFSCQ